MSQFPDTRASLLVLIQSHENREAWEAFETLYQPVIYRMARRRGLQDADALDLVQQVLTRVSQAIERYEPQADVRFRNWLGRVAKNTIMTTLTRVPPDLGEGGTAADEMLGAIESNQAPAEELQREIQREQYLRAAQVVRADVSPDTWQAFQMTAVDGLSCETVAEQLGKSIGTVYASRSRVLRRLKDQITRNSGDEV